MAIYQGSLYGTEMYGPVVIDWSLYGATGNSLPTNAIVVDFAVDPIVANPSGYDLMLLSWTSPTGSWTGLRVLKNYAGYSVNETDGSILLDTTRGSQSLVDDAVRPGAWHYYTLFVKSAGVWQRAGGTSALMPKSHGYGRLLFDSLPMHHQSVGRDGSDSLVENETLKKFLNVLGWGLDYIKTNFDALQGPNDPLKNHVNALARLTSQLGITYEASAPSSLFRQRIRNAAVLGREKGTLEQLQSLISMTTSLNVELSISPNRMVNDDAASFAHPVYPLYSTFFNYAETERVRFNGFVYQTNLGGAYGQAQAPTGTAANNTWWTNLAGSPYPEQADVNGAIAGWEPRFYSGTANPQTALTLGVQSFQNATDLTANALRVYNATGLTADLGARSISKRLGETNTDREQVFNFGAPIPVPAVYTSTVTYPRDTLVNFNGRVYRSLRKVIGVAPNGGLLDDINWEIIGLDDRVSLALSLYAKAGTGFIIPAYPVIEFFDELGGLVATLDTNNEPASGSTFDSFGSRFGALSTGRVMDVGVPTWTVQSGSWNVTSGDGGVAWPLSEGLITIPGTADGNISATFDTASSSNQIQFVSFRGATATSYLLATTKGLYSNINGTYTSLGSYSTAFSDKDRITVNFVGTAITVSRNGVSVLSVTSTVNQASTLHGLGVVSTYADVYRLLY